ncbi:MAG TPA: succinate dehydrogenase cytochrome b subunit [Saprospiraceae bacterium]|nr:succinate dehydrogenase cytochrome b subunit [Saprospiraceae bacterium]HMQ83237.1 succinate dehydrogenase cytochrome b subunit [Saprospiraceae bacterium]
MNWFFNFLTSSIGRKVIMSLTGLFLILFLVMHLIGNLQLLEGDGGEKFNLYAKFMTTNPLIKTISYLLYASILLHAFQGWALWRKNRAARGDARYAVKVTRAVNTNSNFASGMGWLGTIIFIFLLIHLYQFWLQMKIGNVGMATYDGETVKDLYTLVALAYENPLYVIFYVVSMLVIAFHLYHGFQSAFQTLGLNHKKYSPLIHFLGKAYAILVPLGFAIIPVWMYLN